MDKSVWKEETGLETEDYVVNMPAFFEMKVLNRFLFGFTAEEEKSVQPEGHEFCLLKSEIVFVHILLSKLPAGQR